MTKILGIDLGTSNSAASILEAGRPKIIPSAEGASLYGKAFPSVVGFQKDGTVLVGEPARRQAVSNPDGTVMAAKRKMGTNFKYTIFGKEHTPQQISALILQKIKRDAEAFLGEKVEKAVITVPAYFDDNQRQATKDAGTIAGLEVIRIVNEPTAAALAYGLDKGKKQQTILVFDFGGGTLDVTIMDYGDGVFEVKSTAGDTQLGGTDMDNLLINHIIKKFKEDTGIDLDGDGTAMQRVREAAEKAKIELSTTLQTDISLPFISATDKGPKHLTLPLSRAQLESMMDPLVKRCKKSVDQALSDAKLSGKDISKVILVGGPTRMPMVQKHVEEWFGPGKVERSIDPMECVAMGAAIQAGVLAGDVKDVLLLDVTPLSLGIETLGGVFTKLIDRNTTIPVKRSQTFSTAADNQPAVTIRISQGERPMFADNKMLGQFELVGIPPAMRGVPQIEVTFDIDANGILHVTAKDLGTAKEQSLKITAPHKLNEKEVERMRKEAEQFAEADLKKKAEVETVNNADALVYTTETALKDMQGKVADNELKAIKDGCAGLKTLLASKDKNLPLIQKATEELQQLVQKVSAELYQKAGQPGHEHGAQEGHSHEDPEVVDAEFKKKK
ncbi:molecular chaperone DnaK [Candidatus Woesearchaeota archaeon]|nr:molecular chaperone DnaK [Candidatus Woesearchaeota archaeon]